MTRFKLIARQATVGLFTLLALSGLAQADTPHYSKCTNFLTDRSKDAKKAAIAAYEAGTPINESALEERYFTLDADTVEALELSALEASLKPYLYANSSQYLLHWRLTNPSLDPEWIEGVQNAVQELVENPALLTEVQAGLKQIQDFEKHKTWWHNLVRKVYAIFGAKHEPADRNLNDVIKKYNVDENNIQKAFRIFYGPVFPFLYGGIQVFGAMGHPVASIGWGLTAMWGTAISKTSALRTHLIQIKTFFDASASLSNTLKKAKSLHFSYLGQLLSATTDSQNELRVARTAKAVRRTSTTRAGAAIGNLTLLSNLTMFYSDHLVRENLDRIAAVSAMVSELDLIQMYATLMVKNPGKFQFPKILRDGPAKISITSGAHPTLLATGIEPVRNSVDLDLNQNRTIFLTGLNARGKSTYLRMVGLLSILAQVGAPVPAEAMEIKPLLLTTAMKKGDSTADAESTFRAEARRVANLLKRIEGKENLVLADELFSGTSSEEKRAAEEAFYRYINSRQGLNLAASHTRELTELEQTMPGFVNFHVSDTEDRKFQVLPGASRRRNAFVVLNEEGVPKELTELAYELYQGPEELDRPEEPKP